MHRQLRSVPIMIAGMALLSGCFTSTADFQQDAEKFIVENEGLAEAVETTFVTATCDEPVDQNVGTTFACSATDSEGEQWEFEVVLQESNEYEVSVSRFPGASN